MLQAYSVSALSLNYVRALSEGGFADLHHPENWSVDFMRSSPLARDYRQLLESIDEAIRFMETVAGGAIDELDRVSFFTSHEALHLPYEQALTRDRKSTRLNSSHVAISYAVFCLKKKKHR